MNSTPFRVIRFITQVLSSAGSATTRNAVMKKPKRKTTYRIAPRRRMK